MAGQKKKAKDVERGYFRFREIDGRTLVTNDAGEHVFLDKPDFGLLSAGKLTADNPHYKDLKSMGAICAPGDPPPAALVNKFRSKNFFLFQGPLLFIVVPTLRCNLKCIYCHASAHGSKNFEYDMSIETAKKTIDTIFESPGVNLTMEFQGGEPLLNWEVVKFMTNYSIQKNKMLQKNLLLSLVSNLTMLDDEKMDFLIEHKVGLCTSLDGPEHVHNKNRGGGYRKLIKTIKKLIRKYKVEFDNYTPGVLTTVTRYSLDYPKQIVDAFVRLGLEGIHLRHYNAIGFAQTSMDEIGYTPEAFLDFYEEALDYIIDLNKKGTHLIDRTAWLFLLKIFGNSDPNYMDLRSPCGAGIGQIAFNYNGSVYTCDEGRMLATRGDESFRMGNVFEQSYDELIGARIVRETCLASTLDSVPLCSDCAYKTYCGVCPLLNYVEEGSLFAQTPANRRHRINEGVLDMIFRKLEDESTRAIFMTWLERGINVV